jgi:hypothetical protein
MALDSVPSRALVSELSRRSASRAVRAWSWFVEGFTLERVLTVLHVPNGGDVILLRAVWVSLALYSMALWSVRLLGDPLREPVDLGTRGVELLPWLGALFGAVYAGLYARFSSQWLYLANTYNQIKAAECRLQSSGAGALAEWKAGFIEDAEGLHLATKPVFASVIGHWAQEPEIAKAYANTGNGGADRLAALIARLKRCRIR